MMFSVISELPMFSDYNIPKEHILKELEQQNTPNLNVSVLSGIKAETAEDAKSDIDNKGISIKVNNKNISQQNNNTQKNKKCKC